MRILLLSQYYIPEPVEKVHDLACGLQSAGHDVEVLTGFPCYPLGRTYDGYRQGLLTEEEIDGVRVCRVPQLPDHSRSVIRRTLYYLSFCVAAMLFGPFRMRRPDVVLVYQSALPAGMAGRWLSAWFRVPLVVDVVDLWPESVSASGMLSHPVVMRMIRWMASGIYQAATAVNVVTEGFRQNLLEMQVPPEKLSVIENWMPAATYAPAPPDEEFAREFVPGEAFVVMYAGNMGASQHLGTVIDAACLLSEVPEMRFVLVGDGVERAELVRRVREAGLTNVLLPGRFPPERMAGLYALADVLLVHLKPDSLSDVSIPSKTFAYMASGRPVLMAVRGVATEFVEKNGGGVTAEPVNPRSLADAVLQLRSMSPQAREALGRAGLEAYEERFCSRVQIARFEDLLLRVTGASQCGDSAARLPERQAAQRAA